MYKILIHMHTATKKGNFTIIGFLLKLLCYLILIQVRKLLFHKWFKSTENQITLSHEWEMHYL